MDVGLINSYLANNVELTESQLIAADFNGDGEVSVMDATAIKIYLANNP